MELSSSDKERIQHQYDALAKKTLVGEAKSHRRTLAKRAAREVTFSDLSESELAQLFTTDEYESDYFRFQVSGFDVLVKNELLAEALNALPERKRDIILLSYFLDMSDAEIGELLNVVRTTVFRHRKSALAKIKQYLEGKADDEYRSGKRRHNRHVRDLEALRGLHSETLYPHAERRRGQYLFLCGRGNA